MFNKDLLLLDIESTGTDVTKHEIIQLAAILLDKKTLKEKKVFSSYIKPRHWAKRDPEAMAVCKITWDQVKDAPSIKAVLQEFNRKFGKNVIPAHYGGNMDVIFLPAAYRVAGMRYPFEYHTFNMWPICYAYMAKKKKLTNPRRFVGFSLEDIAEHFGIPPEADRHDALGDCRYEAAILRKLLKALKV